MPPFLQVSIAVSATVTDPTEDVKKMSPERRKCLLESETSNSLYKVHYIFPVGFFLALQGSLGVGAF